MFRKIQILPASIRKPISWNSSIYWWGATYPSWFILPPTQIYKQWLAMDSELLFIALTTINGYVSQNTDTACYYTKTHFLKFIHLLVGGNISQLLYLTPHPRFWSSDCLHIMKWLWSITLLKMMKMSYNPDSYCLFTLISHLKYLQWWVGGQPIPAGLSCPPPRLWAVIGYWFWIAV